LKFHNYGLASLLCLVLASCGGRQAGPHGQLIAPPAVVGKLTTTQLDLISDNASLKSLAGSAQCDVTVAQIDYLTSGVQPGEFTNASAAVLIPSGTRCPGPFPLIVFGRATVLEKAQANADLTNPTTELMMTFFAAQGYAVVATDFLGYALSEYPYHPYTHAATEASSMIDSIRAAREASASLGLKLNGKIMISGYSQGGHASMATQREIEQANSGEFNLVAVASLAGPYNISGALSYGATHPINGVQSIVPFQIVSYQNIYGNAYAQTSDVFNSPYASYIATMFPTLLSTNAANAMLPTGTPAEAQAAMFKAAFLADLAGNPNNTSFIDGKIQDLLAWNPKSPTILCGSSVDPTVNFAINAQTAYNGFISRGATSVALVDVVAEVQQKYGYLDPATFNVNYHGELEPPFCMEKAKQSFDPYK
jgi:pimeloyl-ACP methyl ester carboxylesterase